MNHKCGKKDEEMMKMRGLLASVGALYIISCNASTCLSSWSSYDALVESLYANTGAEVLQLPPGENIFEVSVDAIPFDPTAFKSIVDESKSENIMGVPAWRVYVYETNETSRAFVTEVNGVQLRIKNISYNAQTWSESVYGTPPSWITGTALTKWYSERRRDRIRFRLTLVPSDLYPRYLANRKTLVEEFETQNVNAIPVFSCLSPNVPFGGFGFQVYSSADMVVNVFGKKSLTDSQWKYLGSVETVSSLTPALFGVTGDSYFLMSENGNKDSDRDGISDAIENYYFNTDPLKWDTGNSGISDGAKLYRLGLSPFVRDTDGDGYDDEEEIRSGTNPKSVDSGASGTVRYFYDEDDRLEATYSDRNGGGIVYDMTSAGNFTTTHQREAL